MENSEALQLIEAELAAMTRDRSAVVLCCQEGLSLSAAAQVLEVPRETLRDRLHRSLDDLRSRLKNRGLPLSLLLLAGLLLQGRAVPRRSVCVRLWIGLYRVRLVKPFRRRLCRSNRPQRCWLRLEFRTGIHRRGRLKDCRKCIAWQRCGHGRLAGSSPPDTRTAFSGCCPKNQHSQWWQFAIRRPAANRW